jgi:hypothetical protein
MMNNLNAAHLGIAEQAIVPIAENQHIESAGFEVIEISQL